MPLLQAQGHSLKDGSSDHYDSHSRTSELFAQDGLDQTTSRHDPQLLAARTVPGDPYTAWLEQREADRRAGIVATPSRPARRFSRNHPTSAPWYTVTVGDF